MEEKRVVEIETNETEAKRAVVKQMEKCDKTGKELSLFERMGIEYRMEDGFAYPDIVGLEECEKPIGNPGKYGMLWVFYIYENNRYRYKALNRFGKLEETANRVNDDAYELLESIISDYLRKHPMRNPNSFVERWNLLEQTKTRADEIVLNDIVYRFH